MTIEQAKAVMIKGIPVIYRGMQYLRIIGTSYVLNDHNDVIASVAVEDRFRKTVYHASPEEITMHGDVGGICYYFNGNEIKTGRV